MTQYWLMKSEPGVYSIRDLERDGKTFWDGVRNFQARNFLRDRIRKGDRILFYHSNAEPSGVAGVAEVCREGSPDESAWDPKDVHFDAKSTPEKPLWYGVDLRFVGRFGETVSLDSLKKNPKLKGMLVLQRGSRLSVHPVEKNHFDEVCRMGGKLQ